jgi:hypothetical protein
VTFRGAEQHGNAGDYTDEGVATVRRVFPPNAFDGIATDAHGSSDDDAWQPYGHQRGLPSARPPPHR